jgi:predicted nucleotidyltransferase
MVLRQEVLAQLKLLKKELALRYPLKSMALFGSISRADHHAKSDVDILVEFESGIGSRFIDFAEELEKALGMRVDLVSKNGVKPKYFEKIKKDLIYV